MFSNVSKKNKRKRRCDHLCSFFTIYSPLSILYKCLWKPGRNKLSSKSFPLLSLCVFYGLHMYVRNKIIIQTKFIFLFPPSIGWWCDWFSCVKGKLSRYSMCLTIHQVPEWQDSRLTHKAKESERCPKS